jgi:hypothetical protein
MAFSFEFTVPQTVPTVFGNQPLPLLVDAPIFSGSFTFEGRTIPASSGLFIYSDTLGNQTRIDLQTFLIIGTFGSIFDVNTDRTEATFRTGEVGQFPAFGNVEFSSNGANVVAHADYAGLDGTAVPVPEPPSFVLVALGASLAAPLLIRRQKLNRLTLAFSRSQKKQMPDSRVPRFKGFEPRSQTP